MDDLDKLAIWYPCTFCGVPAHTACKTKTSGQRARYMHEARLWPLRTAYWHGHYEATEVWVEAYVQDPAYFDSWARDKYALAQLDKKAAS